MVTLEKNISGCSTWTDESYLLSEEIGNAIKSSDQKKGNKKWSRERSKRNFSTFKYVEESKEEIDKQMKYDKFVKDTIDEYMGVFPEHKLGENTNSRFAVFLNPQNIRSKDESEFINYSIAKKLITRYSTTPEEDLFELRKMFEITKSFNFDIEEAILKNFDKNHEKMM